MTSRHLLIITLLAVMSVSTWCVVRVHSANQRLAAAVTRSAQQRADLARCAANGGVAPAHAETAGTNDLVAQVQRALTNAGVAQAAFRGVQPLAERADPAAHVMERTVQLHLEGVRASDLGAWFAAWCTPGQPWEIMEVTWSHPPPAAAGSPEVETGLASVSLRSRTPL